MVRKPEGEAVFREGEPGDALFIVRSGQVRVVSDAATEKVLLARLGPGEFFGEMALLTGQPRSAAVIAETEVELLALRKEAFDRVGARHPELVARAERMAAQRQSGESGHAFANEAYTLLALSPAHSRVAIGRATGNDIVLDDPTVNARHAEIRRGDGRLRIIDLGSEAGTYVNRAPVEAADLADGDEIWIGSNRLFLLNGVLKRFQPSRGIRIEAASVGVRVSGGRWVLREAELAIYPGELVAIVGSSGAGKSTLLNALVGLVTPSEGAVYYDSLPLHRHVDSKRHALGYVPQDDIVHLDLTVDQSLTYAALLRLPQDTTSREARERIESVLAELGLTNVRGTAVRDLSGGQRKRVSIAVELLTEPGVFLLDEPTSGLDPGLDEQMMQMLRQLADGGRTIVLTTHATRNIFACDRVIFLAGGLVVFAGSPREALGYFDTDDFARIYRAIGDSDPGQLAAKFRASAEFRRNIAARRMVAGGEGLEQRAAAGRKPRKITATFRQLLRLVRRDARVVTKDRAGMALRLGGPPVLAASLIMTFSSRIFAVEEIDGGNAYSAITLLYLASAISLFLGAFTAANAITAEAAIYRRERLIFLSPVAYVLSKVAVLGLFSVLQSLLVVAVLAAAIDFPTPQVTSLALVLGVLTLTSLAGMGMGLLVSSLSPNADRAAMLVVLLLIPQLIFAGSTVPRSEMREPARLVSDATISKWSLELLGVSTKLDASLFRQSFKSVPGAPFEQVTVQVPKKNRPFEHAFKVEARWRWMALGVFFAGFVAATIAVQAAKGRRVGPPSMARRLFPWWSRAGGRQPPGS